MSTIEQRLQNQIDYWKHYAKGTADSDLCKLLTDSLHELESLQKACAEKDTVLSRILPEFMHEESFLSQRGKLTKQMLEHALSTDCGKEYVHISGQEKLANELDRVEDEYTKQLEAAQQRIAELEAEKQWFSALCIKPKEGQTLRDAILEAVATEALENKQG